MITVKEWMELVDYRITEGSQYFLYDSGAYALSSWNGEQEGYSFELIFNTDTQEVYCVEACDYANSRAYRLINPDYADIPHDKEAWDDVNWIDLEVDDDFIQKAIAIKNGEKYDTRVTIPIELSDDELFTLMKMAHDRDMTFNDFVGMVIADYVQEITNDQNKP